MLTFASGNLESCESDHCLDSSFSFDFFLNLCGNYVCEFKFRQFKFNDMSIMKRTELFDLFGNSGLPWMHRFDFLHGMNQLNG